MTVKDTVLITDDDPSLLTVLSVLLQEEGFNVIQASRGSECLHKAYDTHPDLVLLDIMLPDKSGTEVCQQLRQISNVPIIMLTATATERQKVQSLNEGADDYVTKPFNNDELIARIRALLRRSHNSPVAILPLYDDEFLRVDFEGRQVQAGGARVSLSPKEWLLLECLMKQPGRVVHRDVILRHVWGDGYENEVNYLKVFVSHLRHKLVEPPAHPRYIHTERELGYRFEKRG
jgi:two-component system, OmpR family, KDP operon response regulator KdpE